MTDSEAKLAHIIRVDLKSELFTYDIDHSAQQSTEAMDGKLLLVSNVPDLDAQQIVARCKSLDDIKRGFRGAQVRGQDRPGVPPTSRA